jgi:predicted transglutaminase-like cysteine proteinase
MKVTGRSFLLISLHLLGYWILLWAIAVTAEISVLNDELLQRIEQAYGVEGRERVTDWNTFIRTQLAASDPEKLERVNQFFNELNFVSDIKHWGTEDYWATPIEFLGSNAGDCEDFVIAKYFTLKKLGVPVERMNLTYVKAFKINQAHMVLTYHATPEADPLVLDNLIDEIKPASMRLDLMPVYSFNGDSLWLAKERGRGRLVGNSNRLTSWTELIRRMRKDSLKKIQ